MKVVRLHVRPYALPTTLDCSRIAIRASPKMWRQQPAQRTLLVNARYPRKRVQRHASDKPPHQGHRNALRTYVRSPATLIITPNPNESPRKFHGKFGFLPHSLWILQTSWCYPQRIASSITSCKQQRSVRKLQGAVQTPMQRTRYDHRYHGTYKIVHHRSTYPRYRLPHPMRPLQRL